MTLLFQSTEEVDRKFQENFDKGSAKLIRALMYEALKDAQYISRKRSSRFRTAGRQGEGFKIEREQGAPCIARIEKEKTSLGQWIGEEMFDRFCGYLGGDGPTAAEFLWSVARGKNQEEAEQVLRDLNHAGRVYSGRGPKPKEKSRQERARRHSKRTTHPGREGTARDGNQRSA